MTAGGMCLSKHQCPLYLRKRTCAGFRFSLDSVHIDSLGADPHDHPTRRLQLRAASPYDRGRAIAHLHVPLPGMPASHWGRDQQPARFRREQITFAGKATTWMRTAESGNTLTFHFCPICGSTVYWEGEGFPGYVAVAIGNFADPNFPAPTIAVWEESRHPWVSLPPDTPPKRAAKQG